MILCVLCACPDLSVVKCICRLDIEFFVPEVQSRNNRHYDYHTRIQEKYLRNTKLFIVQISRPEISSNGPRSKIRGVKERLTRCSPLLIDKTVNTFYANNPEQRP